jgi:hypothetical protein
MDSDLTKTATRRKIQERRKNHSVAWALGAGMPKDRRGQDDRRRAQK